MTQALEPVCRWCAEAVAPGTGQPADGKQGSVHLHGECFEASMWELEATGKLHLGGRERGKTPWEVK